MEFLSLLPLMGAQSDATLLYNGLAFAAGLAVHVGKKLWTEQVSLREYLNGNKGRTLLSTGSLLGAFSFLSMSYPEAPLIVYLMGGYCIDSLMNKAPLTQKRLDLEKVKGLLK